MRKRAMAKVFTLCMVFFGILTGCSLGKVSQAEEMCHEIMKSMQQADQWQAQCEIIADYGTRVYEIQVQVTSDGEKTEIALLSPADLAGITAVIEEDTHFLQFEDLVLQLGELDTEMTPVSAVYDLVSILKQGYCGASNFETWENQKALRAEFWNPEQTGELTDKEIFWFLMEENTPCYAEVIRQGRRVLSCRFSSFSLSVT